MERQVLEMYMLTVHDLCMNLQPCPDTEKECQSECAIQHPQVAGYRSFLSTGAICSLHKLIKDSTDLQKLH